MGDNQQQEVEKDDIVFNSDSFSTVGQYLTEREFVDILLRLQEYTETLFTITPTE
jgi:hypothetical protein